VKGKRVVRVREVPLSNASLNTGDVFILDAGLKIYIFNGQDANRSEKSKGVEVATKIRNEERGGRAEIILLDEDPNNNEFWTALGGKISVTNPGEPDNAADSKSVSSISSFPRLCFPGDIVACF
jgi:advillin